VGTPDLVPDALDHGLSWPIRGSGQRVPSRRRHGCLPWRG